MNRLALFLFLLATNAAALSATCSFYAGPHFNYTRLDFDTPSDSEGYEGGVTVGVEKQFDCLFSSVDFEGYWNAGRITGPPSSRSSLEEFFVEWKMGTQYRGTCGCQPILFKPYTGVGWNYLENEQNPGPTSITYQHTQVFVPVGFFAYWCPLQCLRIGSQFEYRPGVYDCLHVDSLHFDANFGHGFRIQLPIEFTGYWNCHCFEARIVPFYDWTRFGSVDDVTPNQVSVDIPGLTRWNLGIRLLFGICF